MSQYPLPLNSATPSYLKRGRLEGDRPGVITAHVCIAQHLAPRLAGQHGKPNVTYGRVLSLF